MSADASLRAEFRASNFGFIKAPYGGAAAGTGTQAAKPPVQPVDSLLSFNVSLC
jgi:hypothetical protein